MRVGLHVHNLAPVSDGSRMRPGVCFLGLCSVPGTGLGTAVGGQTHPDLVPPHQGGSEGPIYGDPNVVWGVAMNGQGPGVAWRKMLPSGPGEVPERTSFFLVIPVERWIGKTFQVAVTVRVRRGGVQVPGVFWERRGCAWLGVTEGNWHPTASKLAFRL